VENGGLQITTRATAGITTLGVVVAFTYFFLHLRYYKIRNQAVPPNAALCACLRSPPNGWGGL